MSTRSLRSQLVTAAYVVSVLSSVQSLSAQSTILTSSAATAAMFAGTHQDQLTPRQYETRGRRIAEGNKLVTALREAQPEGGVRTGFDIGMGAWMGQTEDGPGKQALEQSLTASEKLGYSEAATFSKQWNKNTEFALTGAAIAMDDPAVAAARAKIYGSPPDGLHAALYWLGFDIATAIFGDPALGARGNTLIGPGSEKIRATLGRDGQQGFNDSLAFNVKRR